MIKPARTDREKICVLMKALFCRNTLCIARKSDEIRAQIFRKMPQAIDSAFTLGVYWRDYYNGSAPRLQAGVGERKNKITTQRSGCDFERRSSGVSARWLLARSEKSRRKRYEACDDVVNSEKVKSRMLSHSGFWWRVADSNRRPSACEADALTSWANPPKPL